MLDIRLVSDFELLSSRFSPKKYHKGGWCSAELSTLTRDLSITSSTFLLKGTLGITPVILQRGKPKLRENTPDLSEITKKIRTKAAFVSAEPRTGWFPHITVPPLTGGLRVGRTGEGPDSISPRSPKAKSLKVQILDHS